MKFSLFLLVLLGTCQSTEKAPDSIQKVITTTLPKSVGNNCLSLNKTNFKDGGQKEMLSFILKHFKYPKIQTLETKIILSFQVNEQGKVIHPEVLNEVSIELKQEAIRVVQLMKFMPYDTQDGYCNIYIPLRLELE